MTDCPPRQNCYPLGEWHRHVPERNLVAVARDLGRAVAPAEDRRKKETTR